MGKNKISDAELRDGVLECQIDGWDMNGKNIKWLGYLKWDPILAEAP